MSLKLGKHAILIFLVFLMLIVIPISFASDVNDGGSVIKSADDAVLAVSADNGNAAVSACVDYSDDVIGDGEDLVISTNPGNVSNYIIGSSQPITVTVEQSDNYATWKNSIGTLYAYIDINDGEHEVTEFGGWYRSVNTFSTWTFDLNEINSSYFNEGENTLKIAVDTTKLDQYSLTYDFIPFKVYAQKADSKINTTITVNPEELELKVGDSIYFTAILNPSAAGDLTYESSNESVATVSSWGKITAVGIGTANIIISYPGNDLYNAAEKNLTVTVPAPDYISTPTVKGKDDVDYIIGENLTIDVDIVYLTEDEDYWKGYDLSGGNMYVYINGEAVELDGIPSDAKNFTINITDIDYIFEPSKKYSLIFRPSNSIINMANLDLGDCLLNTLTIHGRKYSEDLVISTEPDTVDNYSLGSSKEITVLVEKSEAFRNLIKDTLYAFIDMNNGNHTINYFDGWRRSVTTYDSWTFDLSDIDASYFKVGENILNITVATASLDSNDLTYNFIPLIVNALELTSKINTTINSNYDKMDLEVGDSRYFTATLEPSAAGDLTYKSSNESVATVSSWGSIKAVGPGVANITLSYMGNDYYNAAERNITVTVAVPAPEYTSTPTVGGKNETEYAVGDNLLIDVAIDYLSEEEDYYRGYDLTGGAMYVYINGTAVELVDIASEVKNFTIDINDINYVFEAGNSYSLVFHPSKSIMNMAYLDFDECLFNTLTINVVDGVKDLVISTNPGNVSNYTPGSSQEITVNVEKSDKFRNLTKTITIYAFIDMNNGEHKVTEFGGWYRSVSTYDTWTFDLSEIDVSYFNVGENILNITVPISTLDTLNLTYAFIPLIVNASQITSKINTTISVKYDEYELEVGSTQWISATLTPSSAGSVSYNSSDESVATVSSYGQITAVGPGVANITVSYPGNDYYNAAEDKIITVTVPEPVPDYMSTPTVKGNNVTEYAIGDDSVVDVEIVYLTEDEDYWKGYDLSGGNMYVYINGTAVELVDIASEVKNFTIKISDIDFTFEVGKSYSLIFRPNNTIMNMAYLDLDDCVFNTLTVNVVDKKYDGIIYVDLKGNDSNDGSSEKPVATIAKAIELATSEKNTAHKIVIRKGTYKETDLAVDSDLEIVGEDAIIDAGNKGRILDIDGGDVKISGVTFANANVTGYGGAIEIQKATVEIDNCTFVNNTATSGAGAILWNADDGKLTNSVFENNAGRNGAAVGIGELGWSPKGDNTEIINCLFNNNNNLYNAAGCIGLAVYADDVKVTDCNFTNNHGKENSNHGALYILGDNAEVSGCLFENNSMDGSGAMQADGDYVNIHDNVFNNNTITGGIASRAGAIEIQSVNAEIKNNVFSNNGGDYCREGGAINIVYVDYDGEITISGNKFINNSAAYGGAILVDGGYEDYFNEFTITIEDNTFDGNIAGLGAGIYATNTGDTVVSISDNVFKNQVATEGGAIYSYDSQIALDSNTMENCYASDNGADIFLEDSAGITTEVVLTINENSTINIGDSIVINATLTDDNGNTVSGGIITFTVDTKKLEEVDVVNGTATTEFTPEAVGNYTISGSYNLADEITVVDAIITVISAAKENATMDVSADPITEGENATVDVVLPEDASGNVTVGDVTVPVVNGAASVSVSGLPVGNNTIPVIYSGDDKYNPLTGNVTVSVNPKVEPAKENATMDVSADPITEGENVTVDVVLPEDASGNVTVGDVTVPVVNGAASVSVSGLPVGNNTIPVIYSGDDKYNPKTENVTVVVNEDISEVISAPDVTKYYKGSERFVVNVTDSKGNPSSNKSVNITINGVTYNKITDANGTASIALGLPSGVYNVTTVVDNTTVNSVVTVLTTVNGTDVVKVFRNATQYYATFRDSEGNYLADGSAVRFNINGVMYDRKVNGTEGLARLNINLEAGDYIITAINLQTGEMSSNNITVISRLIENKNITKFFKNATQYTVKVLGDDGNPVGAGENVTFNINGVFYTRQTDENGIAKLNINLEPNKYIITAEYKDCKVSNSIEVLPVLSASDLTKKYGGPDQFVATLLDGQGKPYAGQNIMFNINGVLYNKVTDGAGQAKLNINLMPGEYIITSSYNGCNIANNVKVNA